MPLTFAGTLHWYLDNWRALRCKRAAQARQMVRRLSEFCTPGAGHEKGGIEGEAGYFRRNHWVPIPDAPDLAALNAQLLAACQADQQRVIAGRSEPVGVLMQRERPHLLPLAATGFDLAEVSFPTVDGLGRVRVRTNAYSVPRRVSGTLLLFRGRCFFYCFSDLTK